MKLQSERIRTLLSVLHIPALARNWICVSKLDDAGVKTVFKKDTCKMVQGALVLMQGVQIGTLYKLQGSTIIDGCNNYVVPESGAKNLVVSGENTMLQDSTIIDGCDNYVGPESGEENLVVSGENTMLWHQRLEHIGDNGL